MQVICTGSGNEVVRMTRVEFKAVWHRREGTERNGKDPERLSYLLRNEMLVTHLSLYGLVQ